MSGGSLVKTNLHDILGPKRVFHLKQGRHGTGDGFEFRVYKTRATVLRYLRLHSTGRIEFDEFQRLLGGVFGKYIGEVTALLPRHLRQLGGSDQKQLTEGGQ